MNSLIELLLALLIAGLLALLVQRVVRRVVVFEYQRGLRYTNGRFTGVVEPGRYWMWSRRTTIVAMDVRPTIVAVPGQEIPTADGISLKISASARYQVTDPARAIHSVTAYQLALYTEVQVALREIVGSMGVEAVMAERASIGKRLMEMCAPRVAQFGLTLLDAEVKDLMLTGEMKRMFAQVVKARQEGLAALERARGETAALRNLANAAGLLEQRPSLLQLRLLQAVGETSGNTVVLGIGGPPQTIPLRQPLPESGASPRVEEGEE